MYDVVNIYDAKTNLSKLIAALQSGQKQRIVIGKSGTPVADLTIHKPLKDKKRPFGIWKGKMKLSADFYESKREVEALFGDKI